MTPVETQHSGTTTPERKKRVTVTKEFLSIIMNLHENEQVLNSKEIARVVGLSYSCVKEAVRRVKENGLDQLPDFGIVEKGRKAKITPEMSRMVADHLTGTERQRSRRPKSTLRTRELLLGKRLF